ncbi:MAG: ankyrin repeat domain-containing protein, partial [Proteobacteria bacterium]
MSTIQEYAAAGDIAGIERELAKGVSVNDLDENYDTALGRAAISPDAGLETLRFLLSEGAHIHPNEGEEWTSVLWYALVGEDNEKLRLLVDAQPNPREFQDDLAFSLSRDLKDSIAMARILFEAGGHPDLLNWSGLMVAAAVGSKADVERELAAGGNPLECDEYGKTPFAMSLLDGDLGKIELLSSVSDLNARGEFRQAPLHYAIEADQPEVVHWLIQHGEELNEKDEFGKTPLILAATRGATECVRHLLQGGARIDVTDKRDRTAAEIKANFEEIHSSMADPPPLLDDKFFERMSQLGGEPAITAASNLEIVRLLVDYGADLQEISDYM